MRELRPLTRRLFGQGLGAVLTLAGLPRTVQAKDGAQEVTVRIEGFAFGPSRIEILVGESVTWINGDLAPHTATALDGRWDTGAIEQGNRGRITFDAPGEHRYLCGFHPHMTGTIVVRAKTDG